MLLSPPQLDDHSWLSVMRVHYPLPSLPTDSKAKFKFMKPACVKCIGSFSSDSALQPNYSVDIGITMPQVSGFLILFVSVYIFNSCLNNYLFVLPRCIYIQFIFSVLKVCCKL